MLVQPLGQEDPLEEEMVTHSIFLPENFHGQKSLVGYSPRGLKESDMTLSQACIQKKKLFLFSLKGLHSKPHSR